MTEIAGVILAGGLARRMGGGDKCLQTLDRQTLLERVVERALPQVSSLLLNANGDLERFNASALISALPKANDVVPDYAGPLAGILTGMRWARTEHPNAEWLLSIASDTPFFPADLASALEQAAIADNLEIAVAESHGRVHPVFGLWHLSLIDDLEKALVEEDIRKLFFWIKRHRWTSVRFDNNALVGNSGRQPTGLDPFFNINTPEDLAEAERLLKQDSEAGH